MNHPIHGCAWVGCAALAIAALMAPPVAAQTQNDPKAIWIIAPYAPGGGVDVYARLLAQELAPLLGQPVSVENRPGASGNIGADYVAKSVPDGRVLMLNTNAYAINASVNKNLPFDPVKDLLPMTVLGTVPLVIAVNAALPVQTLQQLVALSKTKDAKLAYSSCGNGTSQHLAGELFKVMTGADIVHIPYKGCAPAIADVAAGQVQVAFSPVSTTLPHAKSGRIRALSLTTRNRSSLAPTWPSAEESGLAGFHVDQWFGMFAPAKTPRPVVDRLNAAIVKALAREDFVKKLFVQGIEPAHGTPEEFAQLLRSDIERWGKLARDIGLKLE